MAKAMQMTNRRLWADGALLLIALLWGATFVPIKLAVQQYSVLGFLGVRFLFALALLSMLSFPRLRATKMTRAQVGKGLLTGVLFLAGYVFQTYGLRYTGAGRAAFITGLNTIFVPLLLVILFRSRLQARPVLGTILATAGMAFLGMDGIATGSWHGDLLVLGAVALRCILSVWSLGTQCDPVLFTTVQVLGDRAVGYVNRSSSMALVAYSTAALRSLHGLDRFRAGFVVAGLGAKHHFAYAYGGNTGD